MALTFYYGSGSPFAWKVWLALEHKKVPYVLERMSFEGGDLRAPAYLAINPRHKVPAIVDDGFALYESSAIVEYLEEAYAATGAPLWPRETRARALGRRIAAEVDLYLQPAMGKLLREVLMRKEGQADEAVVAQAKQAIAEELALLERSFAGDFILGASVSAADFALYPQLAFLGRIDAKRPGHDARALAPARIREWMARVEALPYFDKTYPPHWKE
jgi:glutathione S-transferase